MPPLTRSGADGVVLVDQDLNTIGTPDNPLSVTQANAAAETSPDNAQIASVPGTALNAVLFDVNTKDYQTLVVQTLAVAFNAGIQIQGMNAGGTWTGVLGEDAGNAQAGESGTLNAINQTRIFPVHYQRMRAVLTAYTSGSAQVSAFLRDTPPKNRSVNVAGVVAVKATMDAAAPGTTIATIASVAGVNLSTIKGGGGNLFDLVLSNNSAAPKWFKLYDKAANPVLATDTPKAKILVEAGKTISLNLSGLARFNTGIAMAITGAVGNTDTTAVAIDDVTGFLVYA
jgi:hypothetical protein